MPLGYRPIVVDNGSRDGSREIAWRWGALVVTAEPRGYGAACHAGLLAATAPLVAVMDADASLDPAQLPAVVAPVAADESDLVVGARRLLTPASQAWPLRWANAELARRVRRRTGLGLRDLGPMRAARRLRLLELDLQDRRSGYPAGTLGPAAGAGWRGAAGGGGYPPPPGRPKGTGAPPGAPGAGPAPPA